MQSRPIQIGFKRFYAPPAMRYIEFDRFQDEHEKNNIGSNYSPVLIKQSQLPLPIEPNKIPSSNNRLCIPKTMPSVSCSAESNNNSNSPVRRLFTPFLSTIYNEIVTIWFQEKWLLFVNNHEETFLILYSDITGYLNVQMAINQNCFINSKYPLLKQPECLLIRTEKSNRSLFLPNSIISFEYYCDDGIKKTSHGKLMAIICESDKTDSKLMFYKHSSTNNWYVFYTKNSKSQTYSNVLSNEQQFQLESILKENYHINFIHPSQLVFPLAALCNHPIIYVYTIQKNEP